MHHDSELVADVAYTSATLTVCELFWWLPADWQASALTALAARFESAILAYRDGASGAWAVPPPSAN